MTRFIAVIGMALIGLGTASDVLAQNRDKGNGAKVGKDGYLLNIIAFDHCPSGDFLNSNRHQIAVQANYSGNGPDKTDKINKIFLKTGDFWVQDGNACDDGANLYLPITDANCSDCGDPAAELTYTEYEVYARLVGKPGGKVTVTSCVEVIMTDPDTGEQTTESLCSVGMENIWVETRYVGNGKEQNKWENVSKELLTVCVDTDDMPDGVCDERVGLFDSDGADYWWNWGTEGRPHVQLVFVPVNSGG